jgi:hypothetical protein
MAVRDEIVRILHSRPRVERGTDESLEPDIVNLHAAVRDLQDAVIRLAEEIDGRDAEA